MPSLFSCAPFSRRKSRRLSLSKSDRNTSNMNTAGTNIHVFPNLPTAPPESLPPQNDTTNDKLLPPSSDTMPKLEMPKYSTLNRSSTLKSINSYDFNPDKNFWNIGGYKSALNRCENGFELGNRFIDMLTDRAKLEDTYAKSLKQWKKKWSDYLNTESAEYETGKQAWFAVLDTGDEIAEIHADFCKKLMASPVYKLKQWLKEKYQKHIINFKQKKEFEEEFEEAQKPWLKNYEKLLKAKKDYYAAVKKARALEQTSKLAESNPDKTDDQKRKAQIDSEIASRERDRARRKYQDEVDHMDLVRPRYVENMTTVFNKTQEFEEFRMQMFKDAFLDYHSLLREQIKNTEYDNILYKYLDIINQIDHTHDLNWWSNNRGAGMQPNWPVFEECSV